MVVHIPGIVVLGVQKLGSLEQLIVEDQAIVERCIANEVMVPKFLIRIVVVQDQNLVQLVHLQAVVIVYIRVQVHQIGMRPITYMLK